MVVWVGIPPVPKSDQNRKKLRHDKFAFYMRKNDFAKEILEPLGVIVLDISRLTEPRQLADEAITVDGYHWCSPGPTAVTSFINQLAFHAIVQNMIRT